MQPSNQFLIHQTVHPSNPYLSNLERRMFRQGLHVTAMAFQISWSVAWQLHQPIPSGLWDASHQVPYLYVQVPQVVVNLIFSYSGRDFAPPVPILWSIYSRGYLSLLPLPVHFLLALQFDQQVSTHPCQSLAILSQFLTPGDQELLHSMESILKDLFCSPVPEDHFPGELEFCFPKIQDPDYTLRLTHITQDCELHQCMITTAQAASNPDISSLALVTIRSIITSPLAKRSHLAQRFLIGEKLWSFIIFVALFAGLSPGIAGSRSTWRPPGPQVLSCQAAFQLSSPQNILVHGVVPPQVQDLALLLVEVHEVPVSPFLQPVEVPLDGSMTLWCISHSSQFGVIRQLAEGTLCPIIHVTTEDAEQDWTQY
ncbi:LOW QUALITY PROTEIN: hypothetical protein QYF61_022649 [Mycteria americana]|uniref:Uncharacterized protein n=1 Tax=Mycteria americana TaxID=33587 RepID=A0AAN7N3A9_MYCAM|nr:LOW QUALITY PROTEIN: hypothetical protein QYF61_022649 [Mycteria americana]